MIPKIGDTVIVRGLECRVFKVHPFGTIDAEEIAGPRAFRVSGLADTDTMRGLRDLFDATKEPD